MFSPIEELASILGLHIALGHLYKAKHEFLCASARCPKRRQTDLRDLFYYVEWNFKHVSLWFISQSLYRGLPGPKKDGSLMKGPYVGLGSLPMGIISNL